MATGLVRWFNRTRGYGFISPDLGPRDVFVHASALTEHDVGVLEEGEHVEFELTQTRVGRLAAQAVRRTEARGSA